MRIRKPRTISQLKLPGALDQGKAAALACWRLIPWRKPSLRWKPDADRTAQALAFIVESGLIARPIKAGLRLYIEVRDPKTGDVTFGTSIPETVFEHSHRLDHTFDEVLSILRFCL